MASAHPNPTQQAGGGSGEAIRTVDTLSDTLKSHLEFVFASRLPADSTDKSWRAEQIRAFAAETQREGALPPALAEAAAADEAGSGSGLGFEGFLEYMRSEGSAIAAPARDEDLSWPLAAYYVSSSHNTYLTGNQLYSDSSTDAYKNVLLRGCRCIEVDVWDGDDSDGEDSDASSSSGDEEGAGGKKKSRFQRLKDKLPGGLSSKMEKASIAEKEGEIAGEVGGVAREQGAAGTKPVDDGIPPPGPGVVEPRVLHGYTLTKEVTFRDVCVAVRDYAFVASDLPLIVSLEVHCKQQDRMVEIMEHAWKGLLVPPPESPATGLPSPGDLRNKILVKVKYAPPGTSPEEVPDDDDDDEVQEGAPRAKPSKISQALSNLGIYTRGVSFSSLSQPEATMPTHIFSLSEKKVDEVHERQPAELFAHNLRYLMRTYPHGLRFGSSNLDPAPSWRRGIQVVALNWQNWDEGMMLNEGMFAGTGGYVLKPEGMSTPPFPPRSYEDYGETPADRNRIPPAEAGRPRPAAPDAPDPRPNHRGPRSPEPSPAPRRHGRLLLPSLRKGRDPHLLPRRAPRPRLRLGARGRVQGPHLDGPGREPGLQGRGAALREGEGRGARAGVLAVHS